MLFAVVAGYYRVEHFEIIFVLLAVFEKILGPLGVWRFTWGNVWLVQRKLCLGDQNVI